MFHDCDPTTRYVLWSTRKPAASREISGSIDWDVYASIYHPDEMAFSLGKEDGLTRSEDTRLRNWVRIIDSRDAPLSYIPRKYRFS